MKHFYLSILSMLVAIITYGQPTKHQEAKKPNTSSFKLHLNSGSKNYSTEFYFNLKSTNGLDVGWDAAMPMGKTPDFCIYSKLLEGGKYAHLDFAIQSLHYSSITNQVVLPVSVNIKAGNNCSIRISESILTLGTRIYLEDTYTNEMTLINLDSYHFTATEDLKGEGRFFIHFNKMDKSLSTDTYSLDNLKIYPEAHERIVVVKGTLTENTKFQLVDLQGKVVRTDHLDSRSSSNRVNVATLTPGIYVAILITPTKQRTQKVVIK